MSDYNIIFEPEQSWYPYDRQTVLFAAKLVDHALYPFTGELEGDSFNQVFGPVRLRYTSTLKYWAHASYGVIRFRRSEYVILPLIIHEMGHLFGSRCKNAPTKLIAAENLDVTGGIQWPGMHPPSLVGYNAVEKFANLFADWAMGMLAMNPAGDALRAWFGSNMGAWVATARAQR